MTERGIYAVAADEEGKPTMEQHNHQREGVKDGVLHYRQRDSQSLGEGGQSSSSKSPSGVRRTL